MSSSLLLGTFLFLRTLFGESSKTLLFKFCSSKTTSLVPLAFRVGNRWLSGLGLCLLKVKVSVSLTSFKSWSALIDTDSSIADDSYEFFQVRHFLKDKNDYNARLPCPVRTVIFVLKQRNNYVLILTVFLFLWVQECCEDSFSMWIRRVIFC